MISAISARLLIATLCLLACVTTASAECAWVLWGTTIPWHVGRGYIESDRTWVISYAYETRGACEEQANQQAAARAQLPGWQRTADNAASRDQKFPGGIEGMMTEAYRCYPDTVDPRGPKGTK